MLDDKKIKIILIALVVWNFVIVGWLSYIMWDNSQIKEVLVDTAQIVMRIASDWYFNIRPERR